MWRICAVVVIMALAMPGAAQTKYEADKLSVVKRSSGVVSRPNLAEDGYAEPNTFTGNRSLQWHDAEGPGAVLELNIDVAKAGRYAVALRVARYRTYATHQVIVNGKAVGDPIDMFGNPGHDIVTAFTAEVGEASFQAGSNRIGLKVVGTNDETIMANHGAGIDWIELTYAGAPGGGTGGGAVTGDDEPGTGGSGGTVGGSGGGGGGMPGGPRLEADKLRVLKRSSGVVSRPNLAEDGYAEEGTFTGSRSLQWHDAEGPGAVLELGVDVPKAGLYSITVRAARYRTYATHQITVNGKPVGKPIDMFGSPGHDIVTAFTVSVGTARMVAGGNRLGLKVVGTNSRTIMANYGAGVDWIELKRIASK